MMIRPIIQDHSVFIMIYLNQRVIFTIQVGQKYRLTTTKTLFIIRQQTRVRALVMCSIRSQALQVGQHILMGLQLQKLLVMACIRLEQLISKEIYLVNPRYILMQQHQLVMFMQTVQFSQVEGRQQRHRYIIQHRMRAEYQDVTFELLVQAVTCNILTGLR